MHGRGIVTGHTHPGLLRLQASIGVDGLTLIDGDPWNSMDALETTKLALDAAVAHPGVLHEGNPVSLFLTLAVGRELTA